MQLDHDRQQPCLLYTKSVPVTQVLLGEGEGSLSGYLLEAVQGNTCRVGPNFSHTAGNNCGISQSCWVALKSC
jgi:hypothetical protein